MSDKTYVQKTVKSTLPVYAVGLVFIGYVLCFPVSSAAGFIVPVIAAVNTYIILNALLPKKEVFVPAEPVKTGDADADALLHQGEELLAKIRKKTDDIDNPEIDRKIYRICDAGQKIFAHIRKYPKKQKKIRQFIDYYMPTTLKLLNAYDELEEQGVDGENIKQGMGSISQMLDKIGAAFEAQLDALFSDNALDISTDITVMDSMLAQKGLTQDNI